MHAKQYQLSDLAQAHLRKVKSHTVHHFSELQWQRYKDVLLSGCQMLANNPDLGRSCAEIYSGGFYFPIGKHTVYFTKEDNFILIVAVLAQSQLPQNHLQP